MVGMLVTLPGVSSAQKSQLSYRWGQPVLTAYEGWEEDADGKAYFLFGYMNANWEEELDVSVGPDNYESPDIKVDRSYTFRKSRWR
jgi:hypothetical protein